MVARKYTNSLYKTLNEDEIVKVYEAVAKLALVVNDMKFLLVVNSPEFSIDEKVEILSKAVECENEKFKTFLKILLINRRIKLIKNIYNSLRELVSKHFNTYAGFVDGNISDERLKELEDKLSSKFNSTIKLQLSSKKEDGIKVFIDILNVEVSIDENRIKKDLIENILKAI